MRKQAGWAVAGLVALGCACGGGQASVAPAGGAGEPDVKVAEPPPEVVGAPWWDEAVGYEIFVRSFADSDGDGVGDFDGLRSRLDYLNDGDPATTSDLGVDLLWLMPINESPSYHGYDVVDYRAVERDYGDLAAFQRLREAASARGIRIVMDLVMNHTSREHPWFVDAASGPKSASRQRYVWSDRKLDWSRPWGGGPVWHEAGGSYYYGLFWEGMPDLNFGDAGVQTEMIDVARQWLDRGVAGFRLDAARYLVETGQGAGQADTEATHAFWHRLREALGGRAEEPLLLGEVWTGSAVVAKYFGTKAAPELSMNFDFDTAQAMVDAVKQGRATAARGALAARLEGWPAGASAGSFLTNHDMARLATRIGAADRGALRLLAAALMLGPGTPWIYYGQELGMQSGVSSADEDKRLPMQWAVGAGAGFTTGEPWRAPRSTALEDTVSGQVDDPESLLSLYRRLVQLRRRTPALLSGETTLLDAEGSAGEPLVLARSRGEQTVLVVLNFSRAAQTITIAGESLQQARWVTDLGDGQILGWRPDSGPLVLSEVPARGFRLLEFSR